MSTRRRNDDNVRLYDFAKKYQENQNSSDMVKKQNAAEEKVLLARLEYLNNQKELTKRTMEKEIDLVKRSSCLSGRETSRKSASSYQFPERSFSLPFTPGSTRESLSTGKCEKWFVSQIASRKADISSHYRCKKLERKSSSGINDSGAEILTIKSSAAEINDSGTDVLTTPTAQQYRNLSLDEEEEEQLGCVFEETISDVPNWNSTRINLLAGEHRRTKIQSRNLSPNSNTLTGTRMLRADSFMTSHFTNNAWNVKNKRGHINIRSNYSQAVETRRQEWMRTPTPFPKLGNKDTSINRSLVQSSGTTLVQSADRRNNQLRFSRTMTDLNNLTLRKTKYDAMHGVAAKDLRFKKLESVLVPI